MIDHIGVLTSDYPRSKAFYEASFAPIGAKLMMEFPHEGGMVASGWGREDPTFWVSTCPEGTKPSPVHVAFTCADRLMVDAWYNAAMAAGAEDNGKPGLRPQYHPHYYGAFVIDPDGHKIEAVCHKPDE